MLFCIVLISTNFKLSNSLSLSLLRSWNLSRQRTSGFFKINGITIWTKTMSLSLCTFKLGSWEGQHPNPYCKTSSLSKKDWTRTIIDESMNHINYMSIICQSCINYMSNHMSIVYKLYDMSNYMSIISIYGLYILDISISSVFWSLCRLVHRSGGRSPSRLADSKAARARLPRCPAPLWKVHRETAASQQFVAKVPVTM